MKRIILTSAIIFGFLLLSSCSKKIPGGVEGVQNFDVNQYLGQWYEVARLDHSFERNLSNVTATYSFREDGLIKVDEISFVEGKTKKYVGVTIHSGKNRIIRRIFVSK